MFANFKAWLIRKRFKRLFVTPYQPVKSSRRSKAHVRTTPTVDEAALMARVNDALRRGLSA